MEIELTEGQINTLNAILGIDKIEPEPEGLSYLIPEGRIRKTINDKPKTKRPPNPKGMKLKPVFFLKK